MEDNDRETGQTLRPKYDSNGLISAVVTDASSSEVLMVAFVNAEALEKTMETGFAHFYSRSRQSLWKKGETSGNVLAVSEIRIDCDQDALWILAKPSGPTCHTGQRSCFYRRISNGSLEPVK